MKGRKNRAPTIACPHCGSKLIVRTSESCTVTSRDLHLRCDNEACGATYRGQLSLMWTINASARPKAGVSLPVIPSHMPANENHRSPANDERPPAAFAVDPMTG